MLSLEKYDDYLILSAECFAMKMTIVDGKKKVQTSQELSASLNLSKEYKTFFRALKDKIRGSRFRAALSVNYELIQLYWHIGKQILVKQAETAWGAKLLEALSQDLQSAFPETHGFSVRNLKYMRQFAEAYPDLEIGQQAVAQLPWGHIITLIQRVKDSSERAWYEVQALENGWSRFALESALKDSLYARQSHVADKVSNFHTRLPEPQSRLAHDLLKSPYNFDFLGLHDDAYEREIEYSLTQHITKFLLELGRGFAFVGTQVPLVIENEEFFVDMLFYNLNLRCFLVIELKSVEFKPEHAGKLNFYLSAVDDLMKHSTDNPSVGLLLCKSRNKTIAEYSLRSIEKPIGISEYHLSKAIPEDLKSNFPSIEEIEKELNEEKISDEV